MSPGSGSTIFRMDGELPSIRASENVRPAAVRCVQVHLASWLQMGYNRTEILRHEKAAPSLHLTMRLSANF